MKKEYVYKPRTETSKGLFAVMLEGAQTPSKLYDDYNDAEMELKRLCSQFRKNGYVLKVVSKAEIADVIITKI